MQEGWHGLQNIPYTFCREAGMKTKSCKWMGHHRCSSSGIESLWEAVRACWGLLEHRLCLYVQGHDMWCRQDLCEQECEKEECDKQGRGKAGKCCVCVCVERYPDLCVLEPWGECLDVSSPHHAVPSSLFDWCTQAVEVSHSGFYGFLCIWLYSQPGF